MRDFRVKYKNKPPNMAVQVCGHGNRVKSWYKIVIGIFCGSLTAC